MEDTRFGEIVPERLPDMISVVNGEKKQDIVWLTKLTQEKYNIGEEHGSDEEEAVLQCS